MPLAGVTVSVLLDQGLGGIHPGASTTTDAAGHYQIEGIDTSAFGRNLVSADAGPYRVVQRWPDIDCPPGDCRNFGQAPALVAGEVTSGIDFSLNAGGAIHITVKRADTNAPIANVTILPFSSSYTNADGVLYLGSVPPDSYVVSASADGFVQTYSDGQQCDIFNCDDISASPLVVTAGQTVDAEITLQRGASIAGQVNVDGSSDHPNRFDINYHVKLYDESNSSRVSMDSLLDANGRYIFTNLIQRTYSIRFGDPTDTAYSSEYYDDVPCAQDPCDLTQVTILSPAPGQSIDGIDATIESRQLVSGRIVDATTNVPLVGAQVDGVTNEGIFIQFLASIASTRTDEQGRYTLRGIPADNDFSLAVTAPKYLGLILPNVVCDQTNLFCSQYLLDATSSLSLTTDQVLNLDDIALTHGAVITGRVTDAVSNKPLAGVLVLLHSPAATWPVSAAGMYTNADGYYETPGLSSGNGLILVAATPDGSSTQMFDHVPCDDANSCEQDLATPVSVVVPDALSGVDFVLSDPEAIFSSGFDH
ncbi:MAG: carboxypeptidase regulatory-like domain-containing protein [Rudaea sp.]